MRHITTKQSYSYVVKYKTFQEPIQYKLKTEVLFIKELPTSYQSKSYIE